MALVTGDTTLLNVDESTIVITNVDNGTREPSSTPSANNDDDDNTNTNIVSNVDSSENTTVSSSIKEVFGELGKIIKDAFTHSCSENNGGRSNGPEGSDTTHESTTKSYHSNSQLSVLQNFSFNENDRDEAERFISALRVMSIEGKWSDFYLRSVLESKLSPRARSIYYEGLGNSNELTTEERLTEFLRLFSRKPTVDESQKLFFSCTQGKDERVIAYKLRLVRLSEPLKRRLHDNVEIYENFLIGQFKQGLTPNIKIEILKSGLTKFSEIVDSAIKYEECLKECTIKTTNVATLESKDSKIEELQKMIKILSDKLDDSLKLNQPISSNVNPQPTNNNISPPIRHCSGCGRYGHTVDYCWKNKPPSPLPCTFCGRINHQSKDCYFNPANAKNKVKTPVNPPLNP